MAVIDGIIMKGRHVLIPEIIKTQPLDQCYIKHMGKEKKLNSQHINLYTGLIKIMTLKIS